MPLSVPNSPGRTNRWPASAGMLVRKNSSFAPGPFRPAAPPVVQSGGSAALCRRNPTSQRLPRPDAAESPCADGQLAFDSAGDDQSDAQPAAGALRQPLLNAMPREVCGASAFALPTACGMRIVKHAPPRWLSMTRNCSPCASTVGGHGMPTVLSTRRRGRALPSL